MPNRMLAAVVIAFAASLPAQSGAFRVMEEPIPPSAPPIIGAADFDGDGDMDLLCDGAMLLNDGNGRFAAPFSVSIVLPPVLVAPANTPAVAIADFTGDGSPDALSGLPGTGAMLWVNAGGGGFAANGSAIPPSAANPVTQVLAGDVDGDGDPDAVVAMSGTAGSLSLWRNQAGTFVDIAGAFPPVSGGALDGELTDLDGDGDRDVAVVSPSALLVFWNDGTGAFSAGLSLPMPSSIGSFGSRIAAGDANGDGLADLAFVSNGSGGPLFAILNLGSHAFSAPIPIVTGILDVALVDVDANGSAELILARSWQSTQVVRLSAGVPAVVASLPVPAALLLAADADADGDRDLIAGGNTLQRILWNAGSGLLVDAGSSPTGFGSGSVATVGDLEGDGDVDAIFGWTGAVAVNDGEGRLRWNPATPCATSCNGSFAPSSNLLGLDVDGDGDLDLCQTAAADSNGLAMWWLPDRILLNTGAATWTPGTIVGTAGTGVSAHAGDFDGDGDPDLAFVRRVPSGFGVPTFLPPPPAPCELRFNLGGGAFSGPALLPVLRNTRDLAIADFDGDGDLDIVLANFGPSDICSLLLNDGSAGFTQVAGALPMPGNSVEAADLDGDGDTDLVIDGTWWLNSGTGSFTLAGVIPGYTIVSSVTFTPDFSLFDADADGDPDVVDVTGRLFRNLGSGPGAAEAIGFNLAGAHHADFDRDGDEDLLTAAGLLLTNMTRQLSYEALARPGRVASLDVHGAPGASWLLAGAPAAASLALPPFGIVHIDPFTAFPVASGIFGPGGSTRVSATVPAGPSLVGASVFLQAIVSEPAGLRLTNRRTVTVTAY